MTLHRWTGIGAALAAMSAGCSAAIAQDASRITSVTLYPGSATVERSARVVPGMTRLEICVLPANFDPQTVRVESDPGVRIGEVSTQDQRGTAASNARESAIEEKIQALKDRQAVLDVDAKSAQMAAEFISRLGAPASGAEKPAPPPNARSLAETIEAVRRGGSDAFGRIQEGQAEAFHRPAAPLASRDRAASVEVVLVQPERRCRVGAFICSRTRGVPCAAAPDGRRAQAQGGDAPGSADRVRHRVRSARRGEPAFRRPQADRVAP